jgi:hypothetical protein
MARPFQFRLRTVFWLTALAAVLCIAGPPLIEHFYRLSFYKPMTVDEWMALPRVPD